MIHYDAPHTVYLHRDADGTVIYVGCTMDLEARTRAHMSKAPWRGRIARVEIDSVQPDWDTGTDREAVLIAEHQPEFNIRGNPRAKREHAEREAQREAEWRAYIASPEYQERLDAYLAYEREIVERISTLDVAS